MFLIMGINSGKKMLEYQKTIICNNCGKYGRYEVYMTYTYFSLFFIPLLKWGRQYYVVTTCCNSVYQLEPEKGKKIQRGESVDITESDLTLVQEGNYTHNTYEPAGAAGHCSSCGCELREDYEYCPKCGNKLK